MTDQPPGNTFLTDEHINPRAVAIARQYGAQVITVFEAGLTQTDDAIIIDYAIEHQYIMVTGNRDDYVPVYYVRSREGLEHPGLLIVYGLRLGHWKYIGEMIALYSGESMTNRVDWI
jgi:hypothetical protein